MKKGGGKVGFFRGSSFLYYVSKSISIFALSLRKSKDSVVFNFFLKRNKNIVNNTVL